MSLSEEENFQVIIAIVNILPNYVQARSDNLLSGNRDIPRDGLTSKSKSGKDTLFVTFSFVKSRSQNNGRYIFVPRW